LEKIGAPKIEAMECIGGTGDTLTGLVSSLIYCGYKTEDACILGSKINRTLGEYLNATPRTQIEEIINIIPNVLKEMGL
jgi:NAD(P)H-hydrate repair Nnr-like enzyme with NAD(P)H-hydrate dehydratase domain